MHRKLLNLSLMTCALACFFGGSVLLSSAQAQSRRATCEEMIGKSCPRNGAYTYCEMLPGQNEPMVCWNGRWTMA